jgi:sterol desaturase/sphingolipid hydroxylase (fatty acid hydroxylase superfamily)
VWIIWAICEVCWVYLPQNCCILLHSADVLMWDFHDNCAIWCVLRQIFLNFSSVFTIEIFSPCVVAYQFTQDSKFCNRRQQISRLHLLLFQTVYHNFNMEAIILLLSNSSCHQKLSEISVSMSICLWQMWGKIRLQDLWSYEDT